VRIRLGFERNTSRISDNVTLRFAAWAEAFSIRGSHLGTAYGTWVDSSSRYNCLIERLFFDRRMGFGS